MRNSLSVTALSEFVEEVREQPAEASMAYGIGVEWESGTRSLISTKPMKVGPHRVSRSFVWKADEPRQLLGNNHGPNPQELLLSGLGACMMVSFVAAATAAGVELEAVRVDLDANLDLQGFFGIAGECPVGFPEIRYKIAVRGDVSEEVMRQLHGKAVSFSPNAQTILNAVPLAGEIIREE